MKKFLVVLLAAIMSLSVCLLSVGCGDDGGKTVVINRPEGDSDFEMAEKTKIVTAKVVENASTIYPEGMTPSDNPVYDLFESAMNIELENKWEIPFSRYLQQINLGIISGDLPEIFFADTTMIPELIRNERIIDLQPYIDAYATDELKEQIYCQDGLNLKAVQEGDKTYAMPEILALNDGHPVVWIRADWLEAVDPGTEPEDITTVEKLFDIAKKFATDDPDGNGKKDTYGFALSKDVDSSMTPIFNAYGAYPTAYSVDSEGNYKYMSFEPGMKEALGKLNELFDAGAIDPEFATKGNTEVTADVGNGKCGIYIGKFFSSLWPCGYAQSPNWVPIKMPAKAGTEFKPYVTPNNAGYYVVSAECEHPEALIKIMNNMVSSDAENKWQKGYNEIGMDSANAQAVNWIPIKTQTFDDTDRKMTAWKTALNEGDESLLLPGDMGNYNAFKAYLAQKDNPPAADSPDYWTFANNYNLYVAFMEAVENVTSKYNTENVIVSAWQGAPTDTANRIGGILMDQEKTLTVNIIAGTKELSDWDKFNTDWHKQGGSVILQEMKDATK